MSYILDALKKSEKERQRGTVPDLMTDHPSMVQARVKRAVWPYLLLLALFLNAGVMVWWFGLPHGRNRAIKQRVTKQVQPSSAETVHDFSKLQKPDKALSTGSGKDVIPQEHAKAMSTQKQAPVPMTSSIAEYKDRTQPAVNTERHAVERVSPVRTQIPHHNPGVVNLKELPSSVSQGLPDLTMDVHYYDPNPSSRMINIRGRTLKEGQELMAGLRLEEITPGGAVFSYQGYRFRVGMEN